MNQASGQNVEESTNSKKSEQQEGAPAGGPSNTELGDLIDRASTEDPLVRFFVDKLGLFSHWQRNLTVVVLIVAGFYFKSSFEASNLEALSQSSDIFWQVQQSYSDIQEEASTEEARKLASADLDRFVKALADQKAPYRNFAPLYEALLHFREGETDLALRVLPSAAWFDLSFDDPARFSGELASLLRARVLLSLGAERRPEALTELETLANRGEFVAVTAAMTYNRVAKGEEEQKRAAALISSLSKRQPEQLELLDLEA